MSSTTMMLLMLLMGTTLSLHVLTSKLACDDERRRQPRCSRIQLWPYIDRLWHPLGLDIMEKSAQCIFRIRYLIGVSLTVHECMAVDYSMPLHAWWIAALLISYDFMSPRIAVQRISFIALLPSVSRTWRRCQTVSDRRASIDTLSR